MKKRGFTLTEILISMAIIAVVAVLTVPPLIGDIHTRIYLNQIKNMTVTIEQLAADQMITKHSHNILDTDFSSAANLFREQHFAIVNNSGLGGVTYKSINNANVNINGIDGSSILLKNGVVMVYAPVVDNVSAGTFIIDVNGRENPNTVGLDLFEFNITKKGKIIPGTNDSTWAACAEGNPRSCYGYISANGWKYPN